MDVLLYTTFAYILHSVNNILLYNNLDSFLAQIQLFPYTIFTPYLCDIHLYTTLISDILLFS